MLIMLSNWGPTPATLHNEVDVGVQHCFKVVRHAIKERLGQIRFEVGDKSDCLSLLLDFQIVSHG